MTKTELSEREKATLRWLSEQHAPVWGGHLERGEPITDTDMQRWLEQGIIERRDSFRKRGYRITPAGRAALQGREG